MRVGCTVWAVYSYMTPSAAASAPVATALWWLTLTRAGSYAQMPPTARGICHGRLRPPPAGMQQQMPMRRMCSYGGFETRWNDPLAYPQTYIHDVCNEVTAYYASNQSGWINSCHNLEQYACMVCGRTLCLLGSCYACLKHDCRTLSITNNYMDPIVSLRESRPAAGSYDDAISIVHKYSAAPCETKSQGMTHEGKKAALVSSSAALSASFPSSDSCCVAAISRSTRGRLRRRLCMKMDCRSATLAGLTPRKKPACSAYRMATCTQISIFSCDSLHVSPQYPY